MTQISGTFAYQPAQTTQAGPGSIPLTYPAAIAACLLVLNDDGSPAYDQDAATPPFGISVIMSRPFGVYGPPFIVPGNVLVGGDGYVQISGNLEGFGPEVPDNWIPLAVMVTLDGTSGIVTAAPEPVLNYGITAGTTTVFGRGGADGGSLENAPPG
jgi:hypothetical protein